MHSQITLVTSLLKSVTNTLKSTENTLKEREIYQLALYASSDQLTNQNKPLLHVSLAFCIVLCLIPYPFATGRLA